MTIIINPKSCVFLICVGDLLAPPPSASDRIEAYRNKDPLVEPKHLHAVISDKKESAQIRLKAWEALCVSWQVM